jgi:DNA primase
MKTFKEDQRFVAQTFVAVEPNGNDPCELRQEHGDAAVRDLIGRRTPLIEFVLKTTLAGYDLATVEGRVAAIEKAAPFGTDMRPGWRSWSATSTRQTSWPGSEG